MQLALIFVPLVSKKFEFNTNLDTIQTKEEKGMNVLILFLPIALIGVFLYLLSHKIKVKKVFSQQPIFYNSRFSIQLCILGLMVLLFSIEMRVGFFYYLSCFMIAFGLFQCWFGMKKHIFIIASIFASITMIVGFFEFSFPMNYLTSFLLLELVFIAFYRTSEDRIIRQRFLFLMLLGLVFYWLNRQYLDNAAWQFLLNLSRLLLLWRVYLASLDYGEQFTFKQSTCKIISFSKRAMMLLFLISTCTLAFIMNSIATFSVHDPQAIVYLSEDESMFNIYFLSDGRLKLNFAYPYDPDQVGSTYEIQIIETKTNQMIYIDEGVLGEKSNSEDKWWIISERFGMDQIAVPKKEITVIYCIRREDQIIVEKTLQLKPQRIPSFSGTGKYYKLDNLVAGYGYSGSGVVRVLNTFEINLIRYRNVHIELVYYDQDGHEILSGKESKTMGIGVEISSSGSYSLSFESQQAVRGVARIWVSDTKGNCFFIEEIELVRSLS